MYDEYPSVLNPKITSKIISNEIINRKKNQNFRIKSLYLFFSNLKKNLIAKTKKTNLIKPILLPKEFSGLILKIKFPNKINQKISNR